MSLQGFSLAAGAGSTATLRLEGLSLWDDRSTTSSVIGEVGEAELIVTEQSQYQFNNLIVGKEESGRGTVFVVGETAGFAGGDVTLGERGGGEIRIEGGGRAGSDLVTLGKFDGSAGRATVTGVDFERPLRTFALGSK